MNTYEISVGGKPYKWNYSQLATAHNPNAELKYRVLLDAREINVSCARTNEGSLSLTREWRIFRRSLQSQRRSHTGLPARSNLRMRGSVILARCAREKKPAWPIPVNKSSPHPCPAKLSG